MVKGVMADIVRKMMSGMRIGSAECWDGETIENNSWL